MKETYHFMGATALWAMRVAVDARSTVSSRDVREVPGPSMALPGPWGP